MGDSPATMLQNVRHLPPALPSPAMPPSKSSHDLPPLLGKRPTALTFRHNFLNLV
jgi:hypothetical protein